MLKARTLTLLTSGQGLVFSSKAPEGAPVKESVATSNWFATKPLWWIEKCELLWVLYIYVYLSYICWFLMIYVWRVPCKRDEYIWIRETVRHIEHKLSVWFRRISSQGKKAHFATTGNVAVWNLSFLWFWLASCWIVGWCWMHILRPSKIPHVAVRGYLDGAILPCTSHSSPSGILPALHGVRWSLHMFWTFSAQIGTNFRSCFL